MSLRIGVLADSFDPVRIGHIDFCRGILSSGKVDMILLVPAGNEDSCSSSFEDRWKMLSVACAGLKNLSPFMLSPKKRGSGPDAVLRILRKKFPEDKLLPLSAPVFPENIVDAFLAGEEPEDLSPSILEYCSLAGIYGAFPRILNASSHISRLFEDLNPHRFSHSLGVARTSFVLAHRFGVDPVKAETAGLLHDCAKCLPLSEMQRIAKKHSLTDDPALLESGALLHSVVGAWVAFRRYGENDQEILDAIAYHNTGFPGMSRLAMCVCLADFIEPNRETFPLLEEVRRLSLVSLEKALLLSLEGVMDHVQSRGKLLHPRTVNTVAWLKETPAVQSDPERF